MNRRTVATLVGITTFLAAARAFEMWLDARLTGGAFTVRSTSTVTQLVVAEGVRAGVIIWLAARSRLADPARLIALIGIGVVLVIANNVEAAVFDIAPIGPLMVVGALAAAVHALAAVIVAKRVPALSPGDPPPLAIRPLGLTIRVALLGLLYVVVYFAAGAIIYPFVRTFYESKTLPDTSLVLMLQGLVRGPLFAAVGLLVVSILRSTRTANALGVAITLSGLGGLAALLAPNPLFPDGVRYVHLAEVGVSNFLFGAVVGWSMTKAASLGGYRYTGSGASA